MMSQIRTKRAYGCTIILYGAGWWGFWSKLAETGQCFSRNADNNRLGKHECMRRAVNAAKEYRSNQSKGEI